MQALGGGRAEPGEALRALTDDPSRGAVLCDVDGTLAPIVERPGGARVPEHVARLLGQLARHYACVACITGRRAADARQVVGEPGIAYAGLHGAEVLDPGSDCPRLVPAVERSQGHVHEFVATLDRDALQRVDVRIEDKGPITALHWRGAPDEDAAAAAVERIAREAGSAGLATHRGRKVLELRPPVPIDKGQAVRDLVASGRARAALYGGDDATDLDAFSALDALLEDGGLDGAVRVGVRSDEGPQAIIDCADIVVDGVDGFARVLERLLPR